jgi:prepilin-type N-terminal cleavage/methylation domain-containing protein
MSSTPRLERNCERGFTLVELVIATALFSLFMVGVVGSFAAIMKVHQHSIVTRDTQSNGRLVVEDIARLIRGASEACLSGSGASCTKGDGATLTLDGTTTILLSGGQLIMRRANTPDRALTDGAGITISGLQFSVPATPTSYVAYRFTVNANAASGVGPEWRVNGGAGIMVGSTVALRNGGAR